MAGVRVEAGSFRDRTGRIVYAGDGVYRLLSREALEEWNALVATEFFRKSMEAGRVVATERVDPWPSELAAYQKDLWAGVLRHEAIPFVSYPYEWPFGMLKDAALLQLDLLLDALHEDMILKDASAFNVQWLGTRPVFIDIPSFERWTPGEPWAGYRQFCQMFLYPLFLQSYKNVPFQPWLRGAIDGIDPEHFWRLCSFRDLFRAGVFTHVFLQARMQRRYGATGKDIKGTLRQAGFRKELIRANAERLRKLVRNLSLPQHTSEWSDYDRLHHYSESDFRAKQEFVERAVGAKERALVWDLGANTGIFSRLAARFSRYVVAMDADAVAVERLYRELKTENNETILPLTVNLADASPNLGWRGEERKDLIRRGKPDVTLCLALIHHLVITANIPLWELVDWLAGIGGELVIEFVAKEDPMVRFLLRNKVDQYAEYRLDLFERALSERFHVLQRRTLGCGTRVLFHAACRSESPASRSSGARTDEGALSA